MVKCLVRLLFHTGDPSSFGRTTVPTLQASHMVSNTGTQTDKGSPLLPELRFPRASPSAGKAAKGHSPENHFNAIINEQDAHFILTYEEEKMPLQLKA